MKMNLTELEIRVLGCLMEKELTTPESYPLSLNALVNACNQKSNRDPVLNLTEGEVQRVLEALGSRGLARLTTTGGRVAKYCHSVADKLGLDTPARALMVELMLRGPQTAGELRGRGERMAPFTDVACVEEVLLELQRAAPPFVVRMPRQPGRKEVRYLQVFGGIPEFPPEEVSAEPEAPARRREATGDRSSSGDRVARLEEEIGTLREEVGSLRREIEELLAQFA